MKPFPFIFLIFTGILLLSGSCTSPEVSYIEELRGIANQINLKCPQLIDSETRLDGIEVTDPNTLIYKYTLVHLKVADIDTPVFKKALWPGLLSSVKISADMKKIRDNNTTLHYTYKDSTNQPVCTVIITPKDYQ